MLTKPMNYCICAVASLGPDMHHLTLRNVGIISATWVKPSDS